MKKIIFIFLLFFSLKSFGQFPVTNSPGSPTTGYYIKGLPITDSGFQYRYNWPDTITVNKGNLKFMPGVEIRVGDTLKYIRNQATSAWILLTKSGGSGGGGTLTNVNNGLVLSGTTGQQGGRFIQNTTVSGANLFSYKYDSLTSFTINALGGTANSSFRLVNDGTIQMTGGNASLIFAGDTIRSALRAGYTTNINGSLTANSWITKGYADSLKSLSTLTSLGSGTPIGITGSSLTRSVTGIQGIVVDTLSGVARFALGDVASNNGANFSGTRIINGHQTSPTNNFPLLKLDSMNFQVNNAGGEMLTMRQGYAKISANVIDRAYTQWFPSPGRIYSFASDSISLGAGGAPSASPTYLSLYANQAYLAATTGRVLIGAGTYADQYATDSLIWRMTNRDASFNLKPGFAHIYGDDSVLLDSDPGYYRFTNLTTGTTSDKVALFSNGQLKQIAMSSIVGATPTWESTLTAQGATVFSSSHTVLLNTTNFSLQNSNNNQFTMSGASGMTIDAEGGNLNLTSVGDVVLSDAVITNVTSGASTDSILTWNATTKAVRRRNVSSIGSSLTAGYGISLPSTAIILDTTIAVNKAGAQVISGIKNFTNGINFGGVSSSFGRIVDNGAGGLSFLKADNSGYVDISVSELKSGVSSLPIAITNATAIQIGGANAAVISYKAGTSGAETRWFEPSASGSNYFGLKAQAMAANNTYLWPNAFPGGNYLLGSTTGGTLSWIDPSTLSGWTLNGTSTLTGATTITTNSNNLQIGNDNGNIWFPTATNNTIVIGDHANNVNGTTFTTDADNNIFSFDNTAHNIIVGINTSTPTVALDVNGSGKFSSDNSNSEAFVVNNTDQGPAFVIDNTTLKVIAGADYTVTFSGYTAGVATFDGSGNITSTQGTPVTTRSNNRVTGQTAAATLTSYTVGASDESLLVSANILVNTATVHSFNGRVVYTDEGNTSRTVLLNFSSLAGVLSPTIANAGGAIPYEGVPLHIRAKAGTTVTLSTAGTFTTVNYNFEGIINKIN